MDKEIKDEKPGYTRKKMTGKRQSKEVIKKKPLTPEQMAVMKRASGFAK